ncbi:MAG: zinc ribbon domain-containing protein [Chloroflexi bacterium]|nr:zinc ribbon domain-containing protein [Chloroflexota bacterium]
MDNLAVRIFHGNLNPVDLAQALLAEFNRGNLRAQILGQSDNLAVQIGTRPDAASGGQTALTVTLQRVPDGVMAQLGQQEWTGTAASIGWTAFAAMRNPWTLLNRLDDLAQDVENLQLSERVWQVIGQAAQAAGASHQLSERLSRLVCEYCGTANPVGEGACIACGAPLGKSQPGTCKNCGFVVRPGEVNCPNCGQLL